MNLAVISKSRSVPPPSGSKRLAISAIRKVQLVDRDALSGAMRTEISCANVASWGEGLSR
jgi:hypothetical protein